MKINVVLENSPGELDCNNEGLECNIIEILYYFIGWAGAVAMASL